MSDPNPNVKPVPESRKPLESLRYSVGDRNLGKVKNKTRTWAAMRKRLSIPHRTAESFSDYLKLSPNDQKPLKEIAGYWIGAHCDDGRRARDTIHERDSITFDIDDAPASILDELGFGLTGVSGFEFAVHSTRKHCPEKPRLRIVFPLARPVTAEQYNAAARLLAFKLDPTMDLIDDVSFRLAQMMYWPSCSKDSAFYFLHNEGRLVDPIELLNEFGDWQDHTKLPYSLKQGRVRKPAKTAQNPTEKPGLIGAFCRAYDVEDAIATFLPDVYLPGTDDRSGKPRMSYAHGSGSNGAVVEDGGLFLYSHHGTDPCGDRLVNAWDMVRIHKFRHLDELPEDDDSIKTTERESYKAMVELAQGDERVQAEMRAEQEDFASLFVDSDVDGIDAGFPNTESAARHWLNRDWVFLDGVGPVQCRTQKDGGILPVQPSIMRLTFANKPVRAMRGEKEKLVNPADSWLRWGLRQSARGIHYYPTAIDAPNDREPPDWINQFPGWPVKPVKGDWSTIRTIIKEIIANGDEAKEKHILQFCAHLFRHPRQKPTFGLMLKGEQGAGKDAFARVLARLIGRPGYENLNSMAKVLEKHAEWHATTLLTHLEEAIFAPNKQQSEELKSLMTAREKEINPKYGKIRTLRVYSRYIMTTNQDRSFDAQRGARRFSVFEVSSKYKDDTDFWERHETAMEQGAPAAFLYHLIHEVKLDDFKVGKPLITRDMDIDKIESLSDLDYWAYEFLVTGRKPDGSGVCQETKAKWEEGHIEIQKEALRADYADFYEQKQKHRDTQGRVKAVSPALFGTRLKQIFPEVKDARPWRKPGVPRPEFYVLPPLGQCRAAFDKRHKLTSNWTEATDDDDGELI